MRPVIEKERAIPMVQRTAINHTPGSELIHTMPSTHTSLIYHLIFATKDRRPVIDPESRPRLHQYLGGAVRGLDGIPQGIGGMADHVHLLVGLKPTHCLSDFMREMKKASSNWMAEEMCLPWCGWQEGYGAFTVSASARAAVQAYIANQEEHHHMKSFREELIAFLDKSGVAYDSRYLD
jgi:putative transposase